MGQDLVCQRRWRWRCYSRYIVAKSVAPTGQLMYRPQFIDALCTLACHIATERVRALARQSAYIAVLS